MPATRAAPYRDWPTLQHAAAHCRALRDPAAKAGDTHAAFALFSRGALPLADASNWPSIPDAADVGRPGCPRLVAPRQLASRGLGSPEGRAAFLHAIAHIEFNAIDLALDALWRFPGLPLDFYRQWLQVAHEEATHFGLLRELLLTLGHDYGDFPAHNGLWEMCVKTQHDPLARMALVPRTLEARGLDATPLIQSRLRQVTAREVKQEAQRAVEILDTILRDEIGHVAVGNRWYGWLCAQQGIEPLSHYRRLAREHAAPRLRPPFNDAARRAAGFTQAELDALLGP